MPIIDCNIFLKCEREKKYLQTFDEKPSKETVVANKKHNDVRGNEVEHRPRKHNDRSSIPESGF